jgi:hypothetical protein
VIYIVVNDFNEIPHHPLELKQSSSVEITETSDNETVGLWKSKVCEKFESAFRYIFSSSGEVQ